MLDRDDIRFPKLGNDTLKAGVSRNFQIFDPLDFIAEITQHIPNKGEHSIWYYGFYSNKSRGIRGKIACSESVESAKSAEPEVEMIEEDVPGSKLARSRWAAMIQKVYEINLPECPRCGKEMRIISFIEKRDQPDVVKKILKHCKLWTEPENKSSAAVCSRTRIHSYRSIPCRFLNRILNQKDIFPLFDYVLFSCFSSLL